MMAPARRRFRTTGASAGAMTPLKATTPLGVAHPSWSTFSLIVTGTPCSGPIGPPALIALSCASASRSASSPRSSTTALILPLVARMRATALPTASTAVTLRAAMASASSQALHCHSGLVEAAIAQAVEAEGAAGEHLVLRLGGQPPEPIAEHLRRAREEAVLVRIVGGPHDLVRPDVVGQH